MTYKQLTQYPNHWQRDRELTKVDDTYWVDQQGRMWMPYHPAGDPEWDIVTPSGLENGPLDFLYVNHVPRHVMIRYVGRWFDEAMPPGDRWVKRYDVIFLDDIVDGKVLVWMLDNSKYQWDIPGGEYHKLPIVLEGRNITPKNEKDYYRLIQFIEHELMAEVIVYRKSKDYHNDTAG